MCRGQRSVRRTVVTRYADVRSWGGCRSRERESVACGVGGVCRTNVKLVDLLQHHPYSEARHRRGIACGGNPFHLQPDHPLVQLGQAKVQPQRPRLQACPRDRTARARDHHRRAGALARWRHALIHPATRSRYRRPQDSAGKSPLLFPPSPHTHPVRPRMGAGSASPCLGTSRRVAGSAHSADWNSGFTEG